MLDHNVTVATRVSGIYHVWRYVALSLEAVLDSGQPRSAVYALFEQLYMTVHGFEYDTRHIHLPMLQRQVTLARIHERRQGSAAGRHGNARHGTRSSMKTAQMKDYNERALRHVRTIAQGLANIDWLDVNSIADQVRQYARTLRRSMDEERFAADGGWSGSLRTTFSICFMCMLPWHRSLHKIRCF